MVFNKDGNVFCGQRLDNKAEAWQLPKEVLTKENYLLRLDIEN